MAENDYDEPKMPPADAMGDDRPSDNDDQLNDVSPEFGEPSPAAASDDDDESLLSEVDEAQFADFDPSAVQVAPDFDTLNAQGKISKRQRVEGEEGPKKRKEARRERVKKNKRGRADSDDGFSGGEEVQGTRSRKSKPSNGERKKRPVQEEDDSNLPPEERRKRALDAAMDAALKRRKISRPKKGEGGIDLAEMADQEVEDMRRRMTKAAEEDSELVRQGLPASQKLKMLPQVVALLNRTQATSSILDPDTNLLEAVRFFLEPLSDGSLPAYNIQRELFAALTKLPMTKDALISSGIGKVIVFYRRSKRTEPTIKRQATKLMEEWSRPLLQRSDDYSKKRFEHRTYDPSARREAPGTATVQRKTTNTVGPGKKDTNRARPMHGTMSYSIVPKVNHVPSRTK